MKKNTNNLYVYNNKIWERIDETPTHYVCSPKNLQEGYGYIPKADTVTLIEFEKSFELSKRNVEEMKKYNQWIAKEGFSDFAIHFCEECHNYFFRRNKPQCICDDCENKNKVYQLLYFYDGMFRIDTFKTFEKAYAEMKSQITAEAIEMRIIEENETIEDVDSDYEVKCTEMSGYVHGEVSTDSAYWCIKVIDLTKIK
jgi:hypothetical protein